MSDCCPACGLLLDAQGYCHECERDTGPAYDCGNSANGSDPCDCGPECLDRGPQGGCRYTPEGLKATDICSRLRRGVQNPNVDEPYPAHWNIGGADKLMDGAADEIERLRASLWSISSFRPTEGEGDPHTQIAVHAKRTAAEALTKE
jgi:hypothetical protein